MVLVLSDGLQMVEAEEDTGQRASGDLVPVS